MEYQSFQMSKKCPVPSKYFQPKSAKKIHRAVVQLFSYISPFFICCSLIYLGWGCVQCRDSAYQVHFTFRTVSSRLGHDTVQQILPAAVWRKDSGYSPVFICNTILFGESENNHACIHTSCHLLMH